MFSEKNVPKRWTQSIVMNGPNPRTVYVSKTTYERIASKGKKTLGVFLTTYLS